MLICVLHQPMDAEIDTQHPTWRIIGNTKKRSYIVGGRWLGGGSLLTTRSIALYLWGL